MKHKHGRKVFLNLFALLVMLLLAGTVAFAEEVREQGGDVCGDSTPSGSAPHSPYGYLPLKIQKIWADGQETHDPVKVSVRYYPNRNHSSGANSQEYTVELNKDNNWSWEFDENWEVHFMEEDVEGYKPEIRYSESAADPEGRYLLTLTNRPAYTVTYNWEGDAPEGIKGPDDRGLESDQLPGIAKYWEGETVTKHTKQYGSNDDDRVNVDGTVYVFDGWTRAVTESGKEIDITGETFKMPAENVTITGKWREQDESEKPHTVTYRLLGDVPQKNNYNFVSNVTDLDGESPTISGGKYTIENPYYHYVFYSNGTPYLFSGWCTDEDCMEPYAIDETEYSIGDQDVTIYGKFLKVDKNNPEVLDVYTLKLNATENAPNRAGTTTSERYYGAGARVKFATSNMAWPYTATDKTFLRGEVIEERTDHGAGSNPRYTSIYRAFSGYFMNYDKENKTGTLISAEGPDGGPGYIEMPAQDITLYGYWIDQEHTVTYEWSGERPSKFLDEAMNLLKYYSRWPNYVSQDKEPKFADNEPLYHGKATVDDYTDFSDFTKYYWDKDGKYIASNNYEYNQESELYRFSGWTLSEGGIANPDYLLPSGVEKPAAWITGNAKFTGTWEKVQTYKITFAYEGLPEEYQDDPEWPLEYPPILLTDRFNSTYVRGPYVANAKLRFDWGPDSDHSVVLGGKTYYFQGYKIEDVPVDTEEGEYGRQYVFTMPAKNVTITSVWKERTYRVSYTDGCAGELFDRVFYRGNKKNVDTPAFGKDGAITEAGTPYLWNAVETKTVNGSVVPVREGYSFAGWEKTEGTGGNKWDSTVSECVNYEAKWNPEGIYRLEVHYVDEQYRDKGVKPDIDPAYTYTGNWKAGSKYKIKSPQTVRDYVLAENEPEVIEGTMPSADRIEYVYYTKGKFAPVKYVWTWEDPSGEGYLEYVLGSMDNAPVLPETQSYAVNSSSKVQIDTSHTAGESLRIDASESGPGAPSIHETFVFSGWYFDEERTRVAEDFFLPEEGQTLYGHWSVAFGGPTPYTVSYEWTPAGIPRALPTAKQYLPARKIRVDQTYTNTTEVKINGQVYVFSGWEPKTGLTEGALGADGTFTMPNNNVVFQGKWEPKPGHRVTYEWTGLPEDGTSTVSIPKNNRTYAEGDLFSADRSYTPGQETEVTFADGSRETYTFSGWTSYTAGGTSAELDPDSPSFTMPDADVTIHGEWTKKESGAGYYQVEWYLLDSGDADPSTAVPLPGKETVKVTCAWGTEVAAQDSYKTVPGYTFLGTYEHNVLAGTTTAESPLTLKLYFIVTPVPEGNLVITKEVVGGDAEDLTTDFEFTVTLTLPEEEQEEPDPNAQADAVPENPAETDNPENHGEPDEPDEPKNPDQPDEPEKPDEADEPKVPDDSDNEEGGNGENEPLEALSYDAGEGEEAEENSEDAGGIGDSTEGEDGESEAVGHEAKSEPVTIKYTDRDGTEKTVVFDDGSTEAVTVYLKHDESIGFNLPTGTEFTVIETETDGYTTESRGAAGSVEEGERYTAAFINTKNEPDAPETYTVTYQWSGRAPSRAELPVDGSDYEEGSRVTVDDNYTRNTTIYQGRYTYTFSGWYMDENLTERAGASFTMPDHDVTLYGYWERERDEDPYEPDPTPPTPPTPDPDPEPEPQPEPEPEPEPTPPPLPERPVDPGTGMVPYDPTVLLDDLVPLAAPHLNVTDHYAYIIGYPDGMVKPLGSITRAEVATIFFRLMLDEYRQENWATENDFPDVTADKWYNNAVSTCAKAGIIKGYPDGTFRPNATITRAEFAAIAARFVSDDVPGYDYFTDMDGHWAQIDVARAVMAGWIKGEGRLFRPNDLMNRAETATLVNRMINRFPDKDHLLEGMIIWPDNPQPPMEKWFYEDIQEATNSHDYEAGDFTFAEVWTYLLANRDWAALETEWANAASAPGGEVAPDLQPGGSEDSQGEEPDLSELLPGLMG